MPSLVLNMLGPFMASLDDQPVHDFHTNKVQALLIYLAVEKDHPHRREALMDFLWPEMPLESAQVNLRQAIYRLRQAIPEVNGKLGEDQVPLILGDRLTVQINPAGDIQTDVETFQATLEDDPARAVNLYRGDFLKDFYLVDSNPFENWAEMIRERLRRQILRALDGLTQTHLHQGNYEEAQSFAWKQLELDPLRETAYRQLMLAFAHSGQRNAAICQYEMFQQRLNDELGLEPGEETRRLYEQIQADNQRQVQIAAPKKRSVAKAMPVFMLTDIEGSTQLWDTYHQAMLTALLRHNAILEEQIAQHGGRILELRGDGVKAVFEETNPLACVLAIQIAFGETDWGEIGAVKIRIGLHGVPSVKKGFDYFKEDDQYYGPVLNHTARIMEAGWGGQILVSEQVHNAFSLPPGASWIDCGLQTLRSLDLPVHIFSLTHPDLPQQSFPPLRTLSKQRLPESVPSARPRHNLTSQPTAFVGRQRELSALEEMLTNPRARLVTLVGPGGMGKTRLAFAVAERQVDRRTAQQEYLFPDGVFFVSLVSIDSPDQIIPLMANTLNVPVETSQSTEPLDRVSQTATTKKEKLVGFLALKRMLLVLDNFEHLVEGAEIVSELLAGAPAIHILVTSRERLHIREEQICPISGLDFPEWEAPDEPGEFTAMELFIQSARRVHPDFRLAQNDMVYLTRICRMVGGMPLGLELAASWVNMLPLSEIAAEIQKCHDFLETDLRNLPDRHRSIRAVFTSSWNRLNDSEKQLFARLSIFRGTFPRVAAEKIAHARIQTLANLGSKSLLQYDQESNRYHIHELLRQYGAEQLSSKPEEEYDTLHCFSTFYCREASQHIQLFLNGQTQIAMDRFELDATNIRTAWDWAVSQAALPLVNEALDGLCVYYDWSWRVEDGLSVCSAALDMLAGQGFGTDDDLILPNRMQAKLLSWKGYFFRYYRHDLATPLLEQSLEIINQLMDMGVDVRVEKSQNLLYQGLIHYDAGNLKGSKALLKDALELSKETGLSWIIIRNLMVLGEVARFSGSPREAKLWFGECLSEARAKGNRWGEINALGGLGWAARGLLAYQEAQSYFDESIELAKTSNHQWELVKRLEDSGFLSIFLGHFDLAYSRFFEAVTFSKELWVPYRTLSSQCHMGVAKWLSGDFAQAEQAIRQSLALSKDLTTTVRIFPTTCLAEFFVITGRYREANTQVRVLNSMTQGVFIDPFTEGRIHRIFGWIALAEKKYPEARAQFEKSIELYQLISDDEQVAWSQAGLAATAIHQGNWQDAQQLLIEALWTTIEIQGFIPLLFALPIVNLYLTKDDPGQVKFVYEKIQHSPFLAHAALFKEIAYQYLPDEVIQSARVSNTPLPENELHQLLWSTASQVLTTWLQVWKEESTLLENTTPHT